ncbi:phytanoyl-CoA dioxygenase family protein [Phycicoccus duodecadis]|uniref:Ectoine hydroxylase-related dioxygenase (Phytanoyl-CoA dioxygenase family) n=1 Tax=Phycicoccus duodecadis TaxID=173053 RepID=A0A2N3YM20_9MICO|nr:phytanoyl-CoA dioxygenase family protein [Phycicoccus duodecadis]PKW27886.1 ectoine hydroxylase-related dioxygenase (phytanoyl-CoA dioxygenase family) [Phycicoccus duodecadis]
MTSTTHRTRSGYLSPQDCDLDDLLRVVDVGTDPADYPHAAGVTQGVLTYDAAAVRAATTDEDGRRAVRAEVARALADGPGIVVFTAAFEPAVVDRVSAVFERIIAQEKARGGPAGDHFAAPGANERVWNALEKLAVADPEAFVDYYANDVLALAASAWLGPGYQVTSQVNVVTPGGAGQTVHRDYHLGFQSPEVSAAFPAHVHRLSPGLTLQGAVAHCDMPVESGPTLYLPHSQKYEPGYLAYWLPAFQEYFVTHHVQLPLATGDAAFFNPALFHAAGTNRTTSVRRMANLLQVSSAFGRAMETVDRRRVVEAVYPALMERRAAGMAPERVADVVAAGAEGYAFPTNLDRDQPVGGLSPRTQADVVHQAITEGVGLPELQERLAAQEARTRSHGA